MNPQGWVLYDGTCGICSRLAQAWQSRLSSLGFQIAPLQSPWVEERTGRRLEELLTDIRLLQPDGQMLSGADVYRFIMRRIWWLYPGYLLSLVPGFRMLFDQGYRFVARHRNRISATCGLESDMARRHAEPGGVHPKHP